MNQGVTVSPVIAEDSEGNQVLQDFTFDSQQGYNSDNYRYGGNQNDIYEDSEGQLHHVMEDVELDEEEDFQSNYYEDVQGLVGGNDNYTAMLSWAESALGQDFCSDYDQAVGSADPARIEEAILNLWEIFSEAAGLTEESYETEEEYEVYNPDQDDDNSFAEQEFVNEIFDSCGGEEGYQELMDWQAENVAPETVANFNELIESGNPHTIRKAVSLLQQLHNGQL